MGLITKTSQSIVVISNFRATTGTNPTVVVLEIKTTVERAAARIGVWSTASRVGHRRRLSTAAIGAVYKRPFDGLCVGGVRCFSLRNRRSTVDCCTSLARQDVVVVFSDKKDDNIDRAQDEETGYDGPR